MFTPSTPSHHHPPSRILAKYHSRILVENNTAYAVRPIPGNGESKTTSWYTFPIPRITKSQPPRIVLGPARNPRISLRKKGKIFIPINDYPYCTCVRNPCPAVESRALDRLSGSETQLGGYAGIGIRLVAVGGSGKASAARTESPEKRIG